eukprot:366416-Chlamydomonas_euryale.AAC.1
MVGGKGREKRAGVPNRPAWDDLRVQLHQRSLRACRGSHKPCQPQAQCWEAGISRWRTKKEARRDRAPSSEARVEERARLQLQLTMCRVSASPTLQALRPSSPPPGVSDSVSPRIDSIIKDV